MALRFYTFIEVGTNAKVEVNPEFVCCLRDDGAGHTVIEFAPSHALAVLEEISEVKSRLSMPAN